MQGYSNLYFSNRNARVLIWSASINVGSWMRIDQTPPRLLYFATEAIKLVNTHIQACVSELPDGKYPMVSIPQTSRWKNHFHTIKTSRPENWSKQKINAQTHKPKIYEHALTWWCHPCVIPGGSPWPLHYVQIRQTVHVYPQHLHQLGRHVHTNRAKTNKCTSCNFGTNMAMQ